MASFCETPEDRLDRDDGCPCAAAVDGAERPARVRNACDKDGGNHGKQGERDEKLDEREPRLPIISILVHAALPSLGTGNELEVAGWAAGDFDMAVVVKVALQSRTPGSTQGRRARYATAHLQFGSTAVIRKPSTPVEWLVAPSRKD